jgi:hypothetical protein
LVWHSSTYSLKPLDKLYRKHLMVWGISWCAFIVGMIVLGILTNEPM